MNSLDSKTIAIEILSQLKDKMIEKETFNVTFFFKSFEELFNLKITCIVSDTKLKLRNSFYDNELVLFLNDAILSLNSHKNKKDDIHYEFISQCKFNINIHVEKILKKRSFVVLECNPIPIDQVLLNHIMDARDSGISATEINQLTKHKITKNQRDNIIKTLMLEQLIFLDFDTSMGRKKKIYKYHSYAEVVDSEKYNVL